MLQKLLISAVLGGLLLGSPAVLSASGVTTAAAFKQQQKVFYGFQVMKKKPFEREYRVHYTYAKIKDARSAQDSLQRSGWQTYIREDWR
jgi:hypothetical protein